MSFRRTLRHRCHPRLRREVPFCSPAPAVKSCGDRDLADEAKCTSDEHRKLRTARAKTVERSRAGGRQNNRRRAGRSWSAPVIALAREGQTSGQLDEPARNGGSHECAVWTRRWHHRGWDRAKLPSAVRRRRKKLPARLRAHGCLVEPLIRNAKLLQDRVARLSMRGKFRNQFQSVHRGSAP